MSVGAVEPLVARKGVTARGPLRVRWLGRVRYRDAHALQRGLFNASNDWLLLMEHPHVYTMGVSAKDDHVLVEPATVGAELVRTDRGGDVTYHGPGQLVGYPILSVGSGPGATPKYVHSVEQLVIDALVALGVPNPGRLPDYPGVWVFDPDGGSPRKICAIGVRRSRGRTMHGFALNVAPDMTMFTHVVPCGIPDKPVTSLALEGIDVSIRQVVEVITDLAAGRWGTEDVERQDVAWRVDPSQIAPFTLGQQLPEGTVIPERGLSSDEITKASVQNTQKTSSTEPVRLIGKLAQVGVDTSASVKLNERKPEWLRTKVNLSPEMRSLGRTVRSLGLVTVCEEAGCPNIFECWKDGTATFMINGDRCTRACGFCLVDTSKPLALDPTEPDRVASAVETLGLKHAVVTCVARDDLADGGSAAFAATIEAIHTKCPGTAVEVLISDCKGEPSSLATIFDARPEVLNHNIETVARLQRAARPSASYARSLSVLARAKAAGLVTKSGFMVGLGETREEILGLLSDLHGVGVDIVTIGQYLRPSAAHLPVARWWTPQELSDLAEAGEAMGIGHVEASPLTRSSYHARQAAEHVTA